MDAQFIKVCNFGTYFYPAYQHYGRVTNVRCDRCIKSGLRECIGYGDNLDLCLDCVKTINNQRADNIEMPIYAVTLMMQQQFIPKKEEQIFTLMMQNQFVSDEDNEPCTFMEQEQFQPAQNMTRNQIAPPKMVCTTMMMQNQFKTTLESPFKNQTPIKWQGKNMTQEKK